MSVSAGLSGAEVVQIDGRTVIKRGGDVEKTIAQGRWIRENTSPAMPMVFELTEDGYVMEKLERIDYWNVRAGDVVRLLRSNVWSRPPRVAPSEQTFMALRDKVLGNITADAVKEKVDAVAYGNAILRAVSDAYRYSLKVKATLSHGDPTAENVMNRHGYGPVLIDPIGATVAVPDSPCVDVGKMLQSAYGWEAAKYGTDVSAYSCEEVRNAVADDELFYGGQAWAVVHVIRALPYVCRNAARSTGRVFDVLVKALEEGKFGNEVVF